MISQEHFNEFVHREIQEEVKPKDIMMSIHTDPDIRSVIMRMADKWK